MRRRSAALGAAHGRDTVRLRRTVFGRLFGTTTAAILTVVAVLDLALLVLAVLGPLFGKSTDGRWWLISPVVFVLLWARVITAWTHFDAAGVHTRYWVRFDYPWSDMRSVTLQRLGVWSSARTPGPPAIIVRMSGESQAEDKLAPVLRCGRRRREFATALLAAAHAHGIRTVVGSNGWNETQQQDVDFYGG